MNDRLLRAMLLLTSISLLFSAGVVLHAAGLPQRGNFPALAIDERVFAPYVDALAPPVVTTAINGDPIDLFAWRGTPVIINFWATWCEPCELEMQELQRLSEVYRDQVRVLGINANEPADQVARWLDDRGITYANTLDSEGLIARLYQLRGQPTTVIISPEGVIEQIYYGAVTYDMLAQALDLRA
jgi:thiol-disulfide isomerase/thioredoxin